MFEIVYDDGRLTDGRTTDKHPLNGYTISSPCQPNGSGEVIIICYSTVLCKIWDFICTSIRSAENCIGRAIASLMPFSAEQIQVQINPIFYKTMLNDLFIIHPDYSTMSKMSITVRNVDKFGLKWDCAATKTRGPMVL